MSNTNYEYLVSRNADMANDGSHDDYEYINTEKYYLDAAGTGDLKMVERLHDEVSPHIPEPYINGKGEWAKDNPKYQSKEEIQDAALLEAANNGHLKVAQFLVDKGIKPEIALNSTNDEVKQWANSHVMNNKLTNELKEKDSYEEMMRKLGVEHKAKQEQTITRAGRTKM
ncbi:hypothetical protein F7R25_04120 [Burkholderia stagnalis]|uniref:Ankyrin repeat domain-containing protein n=1 Tax=Burkholderia stagnalis TaxID=1503054 RepID=A0A6L3N5J2_9BURK|nr:hypothetical protein [Burkholderia stagnalis]KAB0640691.1 hypothetical protein F7R25_04120 [Burkholderia stagnalis]